MDNTTSWPTEPSPNFAPGSLAPFELTLHVERLNALRDLVLMLLSEVESLRCAQPVQADCGTGLQRQVQGFEYDLICQALHRTGGNQARAARLLGVKPTTLNAKIRRYQIPLASQAEESETVVHEHVIAA
jgi:transcriptional regulator with GAF, ATPase, and Fis domain